MPITKDQVQKALGNLEANLPDALVKAEGDELCETEGAAEGGGDDDSLKAPGDPMSKDAPKGKTAKSDRSRSNVKKGEFPAKAAAKEDDDDDDDDDEGKEMPPDFGKSLDNEVQTKIEVSDFLKSLVDQTGYSIDGLRDFVAKSDMANENRFDEIQAAVESITKSQGAIGVVLRAICERIGVVENQPARLAKSQAAVATGSVQPAARQFTDANPDASAAGGQSLFKSLEGKPGHVAKSMVSEALVDLVKKGEAADTDVINFETFNHIRPELQSKLGAILN